MAKLTSGRPGHVFERGAETATVIAAFATTGPDGTAVRTVDYQLRGRADTFRTFEGEPHAEGWRRIWPAPSPAAPSPAQDAVSMARELLGTGQQSPVGGGRR